MGRRPSAPISTASARRRESVGRSWPKRESAGAAGSTLQASPLFTIDHLREPCAHGRHRSDARRSRDGDPRRRHPHGAGPARWARKSSSNSRSARAGSSTSTSTKAPIPRLARSRSIADMAIERRFPAAHPRRPLLLARAAGGRRTAKDHRRRRARRHQRRVLADVQYVPAGSPGRPNAALARRHRAARTETRRGQRDDRERQHPRSVLRLWRPGHDGSVARGRSDPAPRLPVRRLGAGGLRLLRPRRWDWTLAFCARAAQPT